MSFQPNFTTLEYMTSYYIFVLMIFTFYINGITQCVCVLLTHVIFVRIVHVRYL